MSPRYLLLFFLLILAGFLQNTDVFNIYGIKPNIMLVFLIACSFFISDFLIYSSLVLAAVILLIFPGGFFVDGIILGGLSILAYSLVRFFDLRIFYGNLLLVALLTPLFYLLTAPAFILAYPFLVFGEIFYNLVLGVILFKTFEKYFSPQWLKTN